MAGMVVAMRALDDGRHRAEFYRMWRAGYTVGLTHPKSLEVMGPRESPASEATRRWLLDGCRRGRTVTDLVRTGGARFEEFERTLLALGEESGRLDESLRLLGDFYTRKHTLMLWVRKQMAYPLFTAFAACFIAPLPLLVLGHTTSYIVAVFGAVAALLFSAGSIVEGVAAMYGRKPRLARARMARALAMAIEAGLPLPRAIRLAAGASANSEIRAHVMRCTETELAGQPIAKTMAGCPHMTPEFMAVMQTAEATGDFAGVRRMAELYEDGFR